MPRSVLAAELAGLITARAERCGLVGLFFDYDGTLVDIVPRPEDARAPESLRQALGNLARLPRVRLAIVTGRSLASLRELAGPLPGCVVAANGGFHLQGADGDWIHPGVEPLVPLLQAHASALARVVDQHPGTQLEDKELSLSVHFRRAPEARDALDEAVRECVQATPGLFRVLEGKAIFEIQPAIDWDKGKALDLLCDRWHVSESAVFFGDDRIDEPAFVAVRARGGLGCHVGVTDSESAAELQIATVAEMRALIARLGTRLA